MRLEQHMWDALQRVCSLTGRTQEEVIQSAILSEPAHSHTSAVRVYLLTWFLHKYEASIAKNSENAL